MALKLAPASPHFMESFLGQLGGAKRAANEDYGYPKALTGKLCERISVPVSEARNRLQVCYTKKKANSRFEPQT